MGRTHVILDGAQDPAHARALSKRWTDLGFTNALDLSGQSAVLGVTPSPDQPARPLTEDEADRAAAAAAPFGLLVRDRVGVSYQPEPSVPDLRARTEHEYRSRLATALMFCLPALALHYLGPILAGGPAEPRAMLYPWLFQLLLVGWACVAAGWPILWQGTQALLHLRITGDTLTTGIIAASLLPSFAVVVGVVLPGGHGAAVPGAPAFHAASYALVIALLQRWLAHRYAEALAGRADQTLPGFGRLVFAWAALAIVTGCVAGWWWGLAVALLMPPMMSLGAVHPHRPGWAAVLPVVAFAGAVLIGPRALGRSLDGVQIETAAGFGLIMTGVFWSGWRSFPRPVPQPG